MLRGEMPKSKTSRADSDSHYHNRKMEPIDGSKEDFISYS